jgi:prepilin-type N-terminal cleavage/methylation domain-containing protein
MKNNRGFTLIEVIIIIIIMGIASALFVLYMNTAYTKSPASAALVSDQYKLIQQMEILTGKYRQALEDGSGTIADLCAFKATYVDGLQIDGKSIVDTANTSCTYTLTDSTNSYTTAAGNALLVTLTYTQQAPPYAKQTLQTIFTK